MCCHSILAWGSPRPHHVIKWDGTPKKWMFFCAFSLHTIYAACIFLHKRQCRHLCCQVNLWACTSQGSADFIIHKVVALLTLIWRCSTLWIVYSDSLHVALQKVTFGAPDFPGYKRNTMWPPFIWSCESWKSCLMNLSLHTAQQQEVTLIFSVLNQPQTHLF